jgi:hypothetical protein
LGQRTRKAFQSQEDLQRAMESSLRPKLDDSPERAVSELTGFVAKNQRKPLADKTQTTGVTLLRNRAHGAVGQNKSRSIKWADKQEKFQPRFGFSGLLPL